MVRWVDKNFKWTFTLPAVLFVAVMMVFPIIYTVRVSLYDWSMSAARPSVWVGLDNYRYLLTEERFWKSVGTTFYFTALSLGMETLLGVAIALVLHREFAGKHVAKTIFLLPMVATPVAMGLVWLLIYEPSIGGANSILRFLGLPPLEWLGNVKLVIPSLALIDIWQWTPMICLIVMAGLSTLPHEPYEAASVDGASFMQKLVYITLPLLRSTIMVAMMLRLIDVLKTFDIIYATTQGGPANASETLNIYGYVQGFQYFSLGIASSLLVIFFAIILGFTLIFILMRKRMAV